MISLENQKKLQNIQQRTESENTQTFDFTDPKKLLKSNTPEDWLDLIIHVTSKVTFPNSYQKDKVLLDLYENAFKEFELGTYQNNEAYAHLFVYYAQFISKPSLDDAADLFNQARVTFRKFAIVHILSAQFELERDDVDMARRILQKAVVLEAQPIADIQAALDGLQKGGTPVYTSPQTWSEPSDNTYNTSPQTWSEPTDNTYNTSPQTWSDPTVLAGRNHSLGSESTDEMQTSDRLSSFSRANTLLPGQVKKIDLPFQIMLEENEEDSHNTTQESFNPIDTNNHTTNGHTSGNLSMPSITCDSTIPMEIEPIENKVKKKPEMPKPLAPKQLEPETPNNKQIPVVPSTHMAHLKVLTVNDQHYAILGVHGKGGSSQVYQCLAISHKIVAIKCVNLDNTPLDIFLYYMNEIELLRRLQYCEHVITFYDSEFKCDENKLYIVMESGSQDLASFFNSQTRNKKQLSHNLIRYYWEIMLEAVLALHKEGIIHLDLKPANFLLVGGKLKLIDFGIAKALQQDKTRVILGTQIGTLYYMSPETILNCWGEDRDEGKKIGVKSDVWSLGCILYNMVYMRSPFELSTQVFFKEWAIVDPDFPIEFPELPDKYLVDVMKKCLTRDPEGRPSVAELLNHSYLRGGTSKTDSPQVVKAS